MLNKKTIIYIPVLIFLISCNFLEVTENDTITLNYNINLNEERTITPSFDTDISYYTIDGYNSTETETLTSKIYSESGSISGFTIDTWVIDIKAYNEEGLQLAYGSATIVVTGNDEDILTINLSYTQISTGELEVDVSWPDKARINNVKVTMIDYLETGLSDIAEKTSDITENSYTYTQENIDSGSYLLTFKFYLEEILMFTKTEAVTIYDGQTSSKSISLISEDLFPKLPETITIEALETDDNKIITFSESNADVYIIYKLWLEDEDIETYIPDDSDIFQLLSNDSYDSESYSGLDYYSYLDTKISSEEIIVSFDTAYEIYVHEQLNINFEEDNSGYSTIEDYEAEYFDIYYSENYDSYYSNYTKEYYQENGYYNLYYDDYYIQEAQNYTDDNNSFFEYYYYYYYYYKIYLNTINGTLSYVYGEDGNGQYTDGQSDISCYYWFRAINKYGESVLYGPLYTAVN